MIKPKHAALGTLIGFGLIELAGGVYLERKSSNLKKTADRIDKIVGDVANKTDIQISDDHVREAIDRAVEKKSADVVRRVEKSFEDEIKATVKGAVADQEKVVAEKVSNKVNHAIDSMGMETVKKRVLKAATERIRSRMDDDIDKILDDYRDRVLGYGRTVNIVGSRGIWDE